MTDTTIALYARASGERADDSLIAQIDGCRRLAVRLGCPDPDHFIDRGTPGIIHGSAFETLLANCMDGRLTAIVTASRDRLSRDPAELYRALKTFADCQVGVHFLDEESDFVVDPI